MYTRNPLTENIPRTPSGGAIMTFVKEAIDTDRVQLTGAVEGHYVIRDRRPGGELVIAPDTSWDAISQRAGGRELIPPNGSSSCARTVHTCFRPTARDSACPAGATAWWRSSMPPPGRRTSLAQVSGRRVAAAAREHYERDGVSLDELHPCEAEGRDGTRLAGCVKVYLPPPAGRFGIVFRVRAFAEGPRLIGLAFGARHHPASSHAPTVYELAHQRLHRRRSEEH